MKKVTPLEILRKQKNDLQAKSGELTVAIENHLRFLQEHFIPLLRNSVMKSAVSKMPRPLRNIASNFLPQEKKAAKQDSSVYKVAQSFVIGIAEIIPFFLKGKKGMIISILLKQVFKRIAR